MNKWFQISLLNMMFFCALVQAETDNAAAEQHRAAIIELLQVSKADGVLTAAYMQIEQAMNRELLPQSRSEATRLVAEQYLKEMKKAMHDTLSWKKMEPSLVEAYRQVYSLQTIRKMTDFYRSEAGQEMLKYQADLVGATLKIVQDMTQEFIPRLQALQLEMNQALKRIDNGHSDGTGAKASPALPGGAP